MKIKLNPDKEMVKTVREGLKRTGGYCPLYAGAFAGHQVYVQGLSGAKGAGVLPLSVVL